MYSALLGRTVTLLVLWTGIVSCTPTSYPPNNSTLPIVDLGYVKQRATVYNETNDWYIFKNVRFAAPPLGDLRFRKPQPPVPQQGIQSGNMSDYDATCTQTIPAFLLPPGTPTVTFGSEDCLLLDIYVPKAVKPSDSVPVFTWFFGGGYTVGSKGLYSIFNDPAGLIKSADTPMIYVAANYRLGAFGWSVDLEDDMDTNIGLYDARAAMDWIKEYIPKFGGDNQQITVAGESAGGGVIMHTITAYGGEHSPPPFQQAILQSAGLAPDKAEHPVHADTFKLFKSFTNCTTLACLRQAPTEVLQEANQNVILKLDIGTFAAFGPVVDGDYVPDVPMKLVAEGKFHSNLKSIMTANNGLEAAYFYPSPSSVTNTTFDTNLKSWFPNASKSLIQKLNELYPKGNSSQGEWLRNINFYGDVIFTCNGQILAESYKKAYRYAFEIAPAIHADDLAYTFYNGPGYDPKVKSDWAANVLQEWITDYTTYRKPGCGGTSPCFLKYGSDANTLSLNLTEVKIIKDPWDNERCKFLQNEAFVDY